MTPICLSASSKQNASEFHLNSILLPTDFSDASDRAAYLARELSKSFHAKLYMVHAVWQKEYSWDETLFQRAPVENLGRKLTEEFVLTRELDVLPNEILVRAGSHAVVVRPGRGADFDRKRNPSRDHRSIAGTHVPDQRQRTLPSLDRCRRQSTRSGVSRAGTNHGTKGDLPRPLADEPVRSWISCGHPSRTPRFRRSRNARHPAPTHTPREVGLLRPLLRPCRTAHTRKSSAHCHPARVPHGSSLEFQDGQSSSPWYREGEELSPSIEPRQHSWRHQ